MFVPIGDDSSEVMSELKEELKNVRDDLDQKVESNDTTRNETESHDEEDVSGRTHTEESEGPKRDESDEESGTDGDVHPPNPPKENDPDSGNAPEDGENDSCNEGVEVENHNSEDIDIEVGGDDDKDK